MFTTEIQSGPTQAGVAVRPHNGEKPTPAQVSQTPPTQAVEPSKAVVPVQESPKGQALKGRAEEVRDAVAQLNASSEDHQAMSQTGVRFSVDEEADSLVVTVVDQETDTVVRQIPGEDVLERMKLSQELKGFLFDSQS